MKLLAEEAYLKMIHEWIDGLYEAEYDPSDRCFLFQVYTVAALSEHIKIYPLNSESQRKFGLVADLIISIGSEVCQEN